MNHVASIARTAEATDVNKRACVTRVAPTCSDPPVWLDPCFWLGVTLSELRLEKMGYNIGLRLIDEFLAKSGINACQDFRDTCEVIAKVGRFFAEQI